MSGITECKPVLTFAEACDRGKVREENQDTVRQVSTALGELVIVADGIGGYRGGATASRMVVESIEAIIGAQLDDCSPALAIAEAAAAANNNVHEAAAGGDPAFKNMGSTVVLALITPNNGSAQAWIGHIGDSRAYLARGGQLVRLTRDHSAVQEMLDKHQITPEQARTSPQSSVLTRSIGHVPDVEIEMSMVDLEAGDALLLCSDGLWGFVAERSIERVMIDPDLQVERAAKALLNLALEAGGHDNIGIEVLRYGASPVVKTQEIEAPVRAPVPAAKPASEPEPAPEPASESEPQNEPPGESDSGPEFVLVPDPDAARRRSGGGVGLLITLVVIAGVLLLAWQALVHGWIPNLKLPH